VASRAGPEGQHVDAGVGDYSLSDWNITDIEAAGRIRGGCSRSAPLPVPHPRASGALGPSRFHVLALLCIASDPPCAYGAEIYAMLGG